VLDASQQPFYLNHASALCKEVSRESAAGFTKLYSLLTNSLRRKGVEARQNKEPERMMNGSALTLSIGVSVK
jgi:hypothetical protein